MKLKNTYRGRAIIAAEGAALEARAIYAVRARALDVAATHSGEFARTVLVVASHT
jgi:hypothetical protein